MKARKIRSVAGSRAAHERDGAAMANFLAGSPPRRRGGLDRNRRGLGVETFRAQARR